MKLKPYFGDLKGNEKDGDEVVFPILRKYEDGKRTIIGTAFFISRTGIFVTAKHVLHDALNKNGALKYSIVAFNFYGNNNYMERPILRWSYNTVSDVAIGVLGDMRNKKNEPFLNKIVKLTTKIPPMNSVITTWAYPKTTYEIEDNIYTIKLSPEFYSGEVVEHFPNGRDRSFVNYPCFCGTINVLSGASGGPVFDHEGRVFAINSTGYEGVDVSYYARVIELLPLNIHDVSINGRNYESISVPNLAKHRSIIFDPELT